MLREQNASAAQSVFVTLAPLSKTIPISIWWIGIGLVLTSATMLRLPDLPIGLGELMLLCWLPFGLAHAAPRTGQRPGTVSIATLVFFAVACAVLLLGALLLWRRGELQGLASHSLGALLFSAALISVFCLQPDLDRKAKELAWVIGVVALPLFVVLFLCAQLPRVFMGAYTVFYFMGVRFSALSINPNQFALFALALVFIGAVDVRRDGHAIVHWRWWMVMLFLAALAGIASRSQALVVGLAIGAVLVVVLFWRRMLTNAVVPERVFIAVVGAALAAWYMAPHVQVLKDIDFSKYVPQSVSRVASEVASHVPIVQPDGQLTPDIAKKNARLAAAAYEVSEVEKLQLRQRIALWQNGLRAFADSPIIGNGPGHFSGIDGPFEGKEAHNTLIDWSASTGIIGLFALAAWAVTLAWQAWRRRNLFGLCGMTALVVFAQFHFVLRQPIFWFTFVLLALLPAARDDAKT